MSVILRIVVMYRPIVPILILDSYASVGMDSVIQTLGMRVPGKIMISVFCLLALCLPQPPYFIFLR